MQPIIKAYPEAKIVLLHSSYPYTREAGYLAAVYSNVFLDFGEIFPFLSAEGQVGVVRQMLELCPTSKLLWSSQSTRLRTLFQSRMLTYLSFQPMDIGGRNHIILAYYRLVKPYSKFVFDLLSSRTCDRVSTSSAGACGDRAAERNDGKRCGPARVVVRQSTAPPRLRYSEPGRKRSAARRNVMAYQDGPARPRYHFCISPKPQLHFR